MADSIGNLAEQVLNEVKSDKLVKLAQYKVLKEAQVKPRMRTEVGQALMKLAEELRNAPEDITMGDLEDFLSGSGNAS
jgi:hypothetical protein